MGTYGQKKWYQVQNLGGPHGEVGQSMKLIVNYLLYKYEEDILFFSIQVVDEGQLCNLRIIARLSLASLVAE